MAAPNESPPSSYPQVPTKSLVPEQQEFLNVIKRFHYTQEYDLLSTEKALGEGVNGKVLRVQHRTSKKICAMKTIRYSPKAMNEVSLQYLAQKDCDNIVKIEDVYYCSTSQPGDRHAVFWFYLILELCEGGELFEAIVGPKSRNFNEREVAHIIRQVAQAVYHLHFTLGIAHRDLKPENILLKSADRSKYPVVKLTDFGFAKQSRSSQNSKNLKTPCYTPYYKAPEIPAELNRSTTSAKTLDENGGYDEGCDLWSLGVILYIMLVGRPPFFSTTGQNNMTPGMDKNIRAGKYATHDEKFQSLSSDAKDLIQKMLLVDRRQRIRIDKVVEHPYVTQELQSIASNIPSYDTYHNVNKWMNTNLQPQRPVSQKINLTLPEPNLVNGRKRNSRLGDKRKWPLTAAKVEPISPKMVKSSSEESGKGSGE